MTPNAKRNAARFIELEEQHLLDARAGRTLIRAPLKHDYELHRLLGSGMTKDQLLDLLHRTVHDALGDQPDGTHMGMGHPSWGPCRDIARAAIIRGRRETEKLGVNAVLCLLRLGLIPR